MLTLLRKVEKTLGLSPFSSIIFLVKLKSDPLHEVAETMCVYCVCCRNNVGVCVWGVFSLIFNGPQSEAHKYLKWRKKLLLLSVNKLWLA